MNDNDLNISNAFQTALIAATIRNIDTSKDIARPNYIYNPTGKNAYLEPIFSPVESITDTKDFTGLSETGFYQINIYIPLNDKTGGTVNYNKRLLEIKGDLKYTFRPNTILESGGLKVIIESITYTPPIPSDSWYQVAMTIYYNAI